MSYVAIRGGERAIEEAARALEALRTRGGAGPLSVAQIRDQLHFLTSRVMSEGGLHDPDLAALALKQTGGDTLEAAFMLRAYRSTRPRCGDPRPHDGTALRLVRRVSAAFKEIPGGQLLGPTSDYLQRLFRFELLDETPEAFAAAARGLWADAPPGAPAGHPPVTLPKVLDALRAEGLLAEVCDSKLPPFDITREPLAFPVPRSAALATLARAETGSLLAIAYSSMRGYGDVHPTVAELRVGYLPVLQPHPVTGEPVEAGEVLLTECEIVAMHDGPGDSGRPTFSVGYGACLGHNEVKAIAMAVLDRSLQKGARGGPQNPSEDAEFVLFHVDGIESMGFCTHYKMPHYVTFQSDMDRLRETRRKAAAAPGGEP